MVVANGCKELQSWSEQRRYSESEPCNQSSHDVNFLSVLPRKSIYSMARCETEKLEHERFGSMSVSPWPFRKPRTVIAHGLRSENGDLSKACQPTSGFRIKGVK